MNEGKRGYKLELHNNNVGRFLLCSVSLIEDKRFSLVLPEGRDFLGGWKALTTKLRSIGVAQAFRAQ